MALQQTQNPLSAGLLAGTGLALTDALATGIWRTPWTLLCLMLGLGLVVGLAAGLLAAGLKRRGLALGLVMAFFAGLNSLSLVSKELRPEYSMGFGAAAAVLALLSGAACLGCARTPTNRFLLLASVPLSSLLVGLVGATPASLLVAASLPLLAALLTRLPRAQARKRPLVLLCNLVLLASLMLPVMLMDPGSPRADLAPPTAKAEPEAPDLVLVIIDTMRADALGQSGPLARVAEQGVRFEQCISAAPWTLPAVASIMTGLLPSQHGATKATRVLPRDVQTVAESLRQAGYQTAGFSGGAFVSPSFQMDQGFEHFDASAEFGFRPFRIHVPLVWRLVKNRFVPLWAAIDWVDEYKGFAGVCRAAERWLAERDTSRPYFLLLHTYEIHDYYLQHGSQDAGVLPETFGLAPRFQGRQSVHPEEFVGAAQADLDYFEAIYKNRLVHVEEELERFLEQPGRASERARVLLVTSDHGEGFDAARGRVHHGGRLHEDLLRVPLLLLAPGISAAGQVIETPVSSVDLAPTLLELAGLAAPPGLAGRSLLDLLQGAASQPRELWSEERANGPGMLCLRSGGWKLLREADRDQYFDLIGDPAEDRALPAAPEHLRARLDEFASEFPARAGEAAAIDASTESHLRQIGYLGAQAEDD